MRQQEQHLHEQQQLQQLQALMQQLPMPDGNSLGSPNSAQHMQLLLEQEISSNMQQAALAAAAAEAANQRLKALRCAMHPPGMLPAGAVGGYAPASAAGSAGLSSSISPIVHGGRLFNDPAVCQPLALGLDCYSYHHQQQQQNPPLHFSPASSMSLPGMEDPAGSPVLQPQAAAGAAYGHSNSTPPGLGFAGIDGGNNPQALLAMLLSQLQGSAAPGVVGGLHALTPACGANTHFQTNNPCASQETASALLAAAAAQMMPAAAGGPGAGLPSYTDASMGAAYAMQPQGECHGFFMP
ncbi:hypothetical protein COO60DRAFT_1493437 [Scenedesmus sp. NREL 46B-D3]|nr:hypothetical protein COO60DRAFT_1493437 [Scenedesmus sp. NREL 46B-D3]